MKTELEFNSEALATFLTKGFTVAGDIVTPVDASEEVPSNEDLDAKIAELKAEHDTQEYARNRASDYPSTGDQLDMMYKDTKNSTTTHATAVETVKTKWPKDNSGPVE